MATDELDDTTYDEEMYTDTSMFDAEEIVRSVEEVAQQRAGVEQGESARKRFERMMEERRLAESLKDSFDDDWPDE